MRGKDATQGIAVWREAGGVRRPAIITHVAGRDIWVSFTDKPGGQAKVTAASLEPRRGTRQ
jgi:hypothetical protein